MVLERHRRRLPSTGESSRQTCQLGTADPLRACHNTGFKSDASQPDHVSMDVTLTPPSFASKRKVCSPRSHELPPLQVISLGRANTVTGRGVVKGSPLLRTLGVTPTRNVPTEGPTGKKFDGIHCGHASWSARVSNATVGSTCCSMV